MINLRYHIVSIVAVFLALGIGLALGSTFVDGFVVSQLETNVNNLEDSRDQLRDDLLVAQDELVNQQAARAAEQVAAIPFLGGGRLDGAPVMIIAAEGVDVGAVQTIRAAVLGSDADYEGVLWLSERLNLSSDENRTEVADALGLANNDEVLVRRALEIRLVNALFPPPPDPEGNVLGGTTADLASELLAAGENRLSVEAPSAPGQLASVLEQLRDAAIVDYDNEFAVTGALSDVPVNGTRFLMVSNADSALDPAEIFVPLFDAVVADDLEVVIVGLEPTPSDPDLDPGSFVGLIRADPQYSSLIATVDGASSFNGTLATLILVDSGNVAHLGSLPTATATLPAL